VRAELQRVEPDAGNPLGNQARILARGQIHFRATPTGEEKFTRLLVGRAQIVIDSLPRVPKSGRAARFPQRERL
jgi:hypothetical protein